MKNRLKSERIDFLHRGFRRASHDCEGHEDRMQDHCARVQIEYFDKGLNYVGRPKKEDTLLLEIAQKT